MRHTLSKKEALRREKEAVRLEVEKARYAQTRLNGPSSESLSDGLTYSQWHDYRPDTPSAEWDHIVEMAETRFYDLILEVLENLLTFYDFQCERGHTNIARLLSDLRETRSRENRTAFFRQDGFKSKCRFYWS